MYQIIAPTLFQNKICKLPGIGTLTMIAGSAESDFVGARINPPVEKIAFTPAYNDEIGFNEFSAISELLHKTLDENGSFILKGIGTFEKKDTGEIAFTSIGLDPVFTPVVTAQRVIRQNAKHSILVGDQQTTNLQMSEYFNETDKVVLKADSQWVIWSAVLAAIGIAMLVYYLYRHGFNNLGNVSY